LVDRLLADSTIALQDRVAGLFILLYAQPLAKLCALSDRVIRDDGNELHVRFGRRWIPLCPILDDFVRQLLRENAAEPRSRTPAGSILLFPSAMKYGVAVGSTGLSKRLSQLGLDIRSDRLGIEAELIRAVRIPRVISDMLGSHIATIVQKADELNAASSSYAVSHSQEHPGVGH
jgi:hypothetical protein